MSDRLSVTESRHCISQYREEMQTWQADPFVREIVAPTPIPDARVEQVSQVTDETQPRHLGNAMPMAMRPLRHQRPDSAFPNKNPSLTDLR